ncbi:MULTISPECIES: macro domain-containing protein [unclassified Haladaptatus]|uniref:macro domain-containing protein n=1 Tax=unclassified Haladaptatus TaxID=2622732 RepID=UPI0023E7A1A4|nr:MULTISPECIES: macro domain-containing protein [unclassified Haladaptatus]
MEFSVVQGDIAAQTADCLVNAANTGLRMGSGVAGALKAKGGDALDEAAVSKGPIDLGDVAVTDGYGLDADYVVHAAAMPPGGQSSARSIRLATRRTLEVADALGCASLVLPAIGCGIAGFDFREGVEIICEELAVFRPRSLADVRLIAYSDEEVETMRAVAEK